MKRWRGCFITSNESSFDDCFNLLLQLSAGSAGAENDWNALLVRFWVQHGPAAAPRTVRRGERDAGLVVEGSSGGPWRKQAAEGPWGRVWSVQQFAVAGDRQCKGC